MPISTRQLGRPPGATGEDTRRRIMEATMRCVAEVGYSRATIREIARVANMTSGSLYHYFPNKSELVKATFTAIAETAIPRLLSVGDREVGVLDKLVAVLDESEQLVRDYPHIAAFERAIDVESAQHLHLKTTSDTVFKTLRNVVVDIIEEGSRAGELRPEAVEGASNAVYALLRGLTEHGATAPHDEHRATLRAAKLLIQGTLFSPAQD